MQFRKLSPQEEADFRRHARSSYIRVGSRRLGTVIQTGDGQFQAVTSGGRNLGYFLSEGAAERVLQAYAKTVANKQEKRK